MGGPPPAALVTDLGRHALLQPTFGGRASPHNMDICELLLSTGLTHCSTWRARLSRITWEFSAYNALAKAQGSEDKLGSDFHHWPVTKGATPVMALPSPPRKVGVKPAP